MNQFDNNNDGIIDFAFFIYAGGGQHEYGPKPEDEEHSYLIWPKEIPTKMTITVNDDKGNSENYIIAALGCSNERNHGNSQLWARCVTNFLMVLDCQIL